MAKKTAKPDEMRYDRAYWEKQIEAAKKRWRTFWDDGDEVIDTYRLQKVQGVNIGAQDRYNILYSSTETIRPNLYAQRPNARVPLRHKDRTNPVARTAVQLLEKALQYVIEEEDFDDVLENCVEDLLLPGIGQAWVRYEPVVVAKAQPDGTVVEEVEDEITAIEHVYWQDWLCGPSRGWKTVPWVAKRVWLTEEKAAKRFGEAKARQLAFKVQERNARDESTGDETAEVWEVWCKTTREVYWYSPDYPELLDAKKDPLKLKGYFPCPRPLRAVYNTRTFVPRALYSQYKSQARQLDNLTRRIRYLTDAIRVAGVYDGSQEGLKDLLNTAHGNRMIRVDSWVAFAQQGGLKGSVEWLPLQDIVNALRELIASREICKNEIYEITGFSDIVRGVSKASETLGAQNIKQNWASARLRKMQKEVQRFARDIIAICGEVMSEHCSPVTFALYGGVDLPQTAPNVPLDPAATAVVQNFMQAVALLRNEKLRCAKIEIETDSTLLADAEQERKDRMDFLGAAGAFLQQAVPAMKDMPEMGALLGAMMMFTVRTFPTSRVIEDEFEKVQKVLEQKVANPAPPPPDPNAVRAQSQERIAQGRMQTDTARIQTDAQLGAEKLALEERIATAELDLKRDAENNRHAERMLELQIELQKLQQADASSAIDAELRIRDQEHSHSMAERSQDHTEFKDTVEHSLTENAQAHEQDKDSAAHDLATRQQDHTESTAAAQEALQYEQMERDSENSPPSDDMT